MKVGYVFKRPWNWRLFSMLDSYSRLVMYYKLALSIAFKCSFNLRLCRVLVQCGRFWWHVGLLRVNASSITNVDCYAIELYKACVRTNKPGGLSVLTSWEQQLDIITTRSSFNSSDSLAARSPAWVIQFVKLMERRKMTFTEISYNDQSSVKSSSTGLLPQRHQSDCPVLNRQWQLVPQTTWNPEMNSKSWTAPNHQVQMIYLRPLLKIATTWLGDWLSCLQISGN